MDPTRTGRKIYYGWVITGLAFIILFTAYGVQYSFGVFLPEMEASLAPGERAALSLGFAVYSILYALLSVVTGALTDRWGPRPVLVFGGLLLGSSLALVSRTTELWQYYVAYGLLAAVGMSTILVPTTSTVAKWFAYQRGLAIGIVTTGIGLGQLLIPPLTSLLIEGWGWRTGYLVYGVAILLVVTLAGLRMVRDPEAMGLTPYSARAGGADGDSAVAVGEPDFTPSEAIRTSAFWLFTVAIFLFWTVVFLPPTHLPAFAKDTLQASPVQASFMLTALALGSTIARFLAGVVSDRSGVKQAFVLVIWIQFAGFLGLIAASAVESLPLAYVAAAVVGIGIGSTTSIYPLFTADLFGRAHASSISGIVFSIAGSATGIGIYAGGLIRDATGDYLIAFAIGAALTLSALAPLLALRPQAVVLQEQRGEG